MNFVGLWNAGSAGSTSIMVSRVAMGRSKGSTFPSSCSIMYPIMPSVSAPRTSKG